MNLNSSKLTKKRLELQRYRSGKGKTSSRGHKGQKSRSGIAIKSLRVVRCPFTEDYLREDLKILKKKYSNFKFI